MALRLRGSTSGYAEIDAPAVAGDVTLTLPSTTGTINVKDASGNTNVGTGVTFGNPGANIFTVNNTGGERLRIAADGTVSIPGALNVSGVLTYEDVTSVDAIGLSTFRDGLNTKDVGLTEISSTNVNNSGTAVDVFIYDTSKDSDGGEWRKRTNHTSWYNDSLLNTSIRGSRREFPAVAVIVAEASKVTIYDGDDPDLPLWISFPTTNAKAVTALNGELCLACDDGAPSYHSLLRINFVADRAYNHRASTNATVQGIFLKSLSSTDLQLLDDGSSYFSGYDANIVPNISNNNADDVEMTVLPNAPIDVATGLPVPTIAVATHSGVSVVTDAGNIFDGFDTVQQGGVAFDKDNNLYISRLGERIYISEYPEYTLGDGFGTTRIDNLADFKVTQGVTAITAFLPTAKSADSIGVHLFDYPNKKYSYITSSYNTGWMHGDVKGAFLSDTSTTNLVATDLDIVTNGSFATDSDWTKGTGWTISGGTATHTGSGGDFNQQIAVVTGRTYLMTVTVDLTGDTSVVNTSIGLRTLANDGYYVSKSSWTANASNTAELYWTSTVTGNILARCYSEDDVSLDNWVVQDVTDGNSDRSVNNKGFQVFGTITKTSVATGADLVGYQNTTGSVNNYLKQPYNSGMDFGTDSFSVTWWMKITGNIANSEYVYDRQGGNGNRHAIYYSSPNNGSLNFYTTVPGSASEMYAENINDYKDQWTCYTAVRYSNGDMTIFINGDVGYAATGLTMRDLDNTSASLFIGIRHSVDGNAMSQTELALMRFSKSVPSPEQIKKIYEDEKVLFQENAKATLYGSSDAVTALGYDEITDQLHVGTSSGRSDFQGLRRINNTTQQVQTAISAHDTFIIEQ